MPAADEIEIRSADFSIGQEYSALLARAEGSGACVLFTGLVRSEGGANPVTAMELEHYPGMTEQSIAAIVATARQRWRLDAVRVIHRVGHLEPGEQIVLVGVASAHRGEAFAACEFIMDYLKTNAPIWKKEIGTAGARWVERRERDDAAASRWSDNTAGKEEGGGA